MRDCHEHDPGTQAKANDFGVVRDERRRVGMRVCWTRHGRPVTRNDRPTRARALRALAVSVTAVAVLASAADNAAAALPPENAAQQWDQIAEDTVVGSG